MCFICCRWINKTKQLGNIHFQVNHIFRWIAMQSGKEELIWVAFPVTYILRHTSKIFLLKICCLFSSFLPRLSLLLFSLYRWASNFIKYKQSPGNRIAPLKIFDFIDGCLLYMQCLTSYVAWNQFFGFCCFCCWIMIATECSQLVPQLISIITIIFVLMREGNTDGQNATNEQKRGGQGFCSVNDV